MCRSHMFRFLGLSLLDTSLLLEAGSSLLMIDTGIANDQVGPFLYVEEFMKAKANGSYNRACVIFVVKFDDARDFEPKSSTDPEFAERFRQAITKGFRSIYMHDRLYAGLYEPVEIDSD